MLFAGSASSRNRSAKPGCSIAPAGQESLAPNGSPPGKTRVGRAFLLVRELTDAVDLRTYLAGVSSRSAERRKFFHSLGAAIAKLHLASFDHPDLYSKHVLVGPDGSSHIVNWQRSRRLRSLGARRRCQNLAALHATLGNSLASARSARLPAILRSIPLVGAVARRACGNAADDYEPGGAVDAPPPCQRDAPSAASFPSTAAGMA